MGFASVRTILFVLCLGGGTAWAGFDDFAGTTPTTGEQEKATNSIVTETQPTLTLELPSEELESQRDGIIPVPPPTPLYFTPPPPAITAPLPPALMSGAALLLGNFVLTKFFKRRIR